MDVWMEGIKYAASGHSNAPPQRHQKVYELTGSSGLLAAQSRPQTFKITVVCSEIFKYPEALSCEVPPPNVIQRQSQSTKSYRSNKVQQTRSSYICDI